LTVPTLMRNVRNIARRPMKRESTKIRGDAVRR
jgi:hypothetical protein